ncbi:MAG: hypothetical protein QM479_04250 [Pseudomonadota bacterium]
MPKRTNKFQQVIYMMQKQLADNAVVTESKLLENIRTGATAEVDTLMRKYLEHWQSSAQTQVAYCRQHNIPIHVFSYYKKKLGSTVSESPSNGKNNQLIPIHLISEATAVEPIQVNHTNGFSLQINPEDVTHLKPLLELLSSIA